MPPTTQELVDAVFARMQAGGISYRAFQAHTAISKDTLALWRKNGAPKRVTRQLQSACQYFGIQTNADGGSPTNSPQVHTRLARAVERLTGLAPTKAEKVAELLELVVHLAEDVRAR